MDKLVLIVLVALSSVSLSHWWVTASFVDRYGFVFVPLLAFLQLTVLGGLFQAERTLANETNLFQYARLSKSSTTVWCKVVFITGCFFASIILAGHNLTVLAWQMNIFYSIITQPYQLSDFQLLLDNQDSIMGGIGQQGLWLFVAFSVCLLLYSCLYSQRLQRIIAPMVMVLVITGLLLFGMFFFWQHNAEFSLQSIVDSHVDWSTLFSAALTMTIETSLVGFGVLFVLRQITRHNLEQGFLILSLILIVLLTCVLAVGGWTISSAVAGVSTEFSADRMMILAPLYMQTLADGSITLWLWIWCVVSLVVLKTVLLAGVCLYVFHRYFFPHFRENRVLVPVLIALISFCGLALTFLVTDSSSFDVSLFFRDVFIIFFYYWSPLHLALMCWLAFCKPSVAHSNLLPENLFWLDSSVRWYYLFLMVMLLAFWMYRTGIGVL